MGQRPHLHRVENVKIEGMAPSFSACPAILDRLLHHSTMLNVRRELPTQGEAQSGGVRPSERYPAPALRRRLRNGEPGYGSCRPVESRDEAAPSHRTWITPT